MTALAPRCHRLMERREKPGRPVLEDPYCGRRKDHPGNCASEESMQRAALRRKGPRAAERRDRYRVLREAGMSATEATRLKHRAALPDALLLKAHARAVQLRAEGLPVPPKVRVLDAEYHQRRRRLRGADSGGRKAVQRARAEAGDERAA